MKYILLLSSLFAFNIKAEELEAADLAMADEAIQSPTINLEGHIKKEEEIKPAVVEVVKEEPVKVIPRPVKKVSASDRLKLYRERLEERNRIMVEKKMEQIRYQQEIALARKLEQSMNQTLKAIDNIK